AHPGVTGVTRTNSPPVYLESTISGDDLSWEGKTANDHVSNFGLMGVGPGFDRIFKPKMVAGRFFDEEMPTDMTGGAILNEAALRLLGMEDPVGKSLTVNGNTYSIIGVVKDFNLESLHKTVNPMAMLPNWGIDCVCVGMRGSEGGAGVRRGEDGAPASEAVAAGSENGTPGDKVGDGSEAGTPVASSGAGLTGNAADITGTGPMESMAGTGIDDVLAFIETTVRQFDPGAQLNYRFLDEMRMDNYATEMRTERIVKYGTGMAIFISCLGLLGLAAYTAEQRTKEIGIRKVLGASVGGIIMLLSRSFIRWVLISNLIAWPLAWFAGRKWLENFAYRTPMDIWVFLLASLSALAFAIGITAWQAWRAARTNPIDSLKYE
ncbi:MAG TPA: ABC transporter permease, partial [Candidatus Krumholzibacterium sp.]|nr:ABC transporter permease [Candidatus Krumholzibacterium sp.]